MKPGIFRASLDFFHYSGISRAARPLTGGAGAIFMLHHVRPAPAGERDFAPNAGLDVTPEFLDAVISFVKARGWRLVSLEEAARLLRERDFDRPFAAFTLDDGFRDNRQHALEVFARHDCPFTIFIAPKYADGQGELWWDALEEAIAGNGVIYPGIPGLPEKITCLDDAARQRAWDQLYWPVRSMPQHDQRRWIRRFAPAHGVDLEALCRREIMGWEEIREIAAHPLCTIGAHTMNHFALRLLDDKEAFSEMVLSKARLEEELGREIRTFAYPYGDATTAGPRDFALAGRAGFDVAVTTRKGLLYEQHRDHLMALPRVSLNGFYQKIRYLDVLLSGAPFMLFNRLRKVNVA